MNIMIAMLMVGAGFTKAELDALPKPDPHFFDNLPHEKRPGEKRAVQDLRSPMMQQSLAQKAMRRRQWSRQHDARYGYDPGMEAVIGTARQFYVNSFQRTW
jgi:hypothetical protein